jgi:3-oxoacyl-[acyl-carrier protein] reductase
MDLKLGGRVALITGPAKGMGAAITRAFAAEGSRLALIGRDTAAIEALADEVRAGGAEATVLTCDISDAEQCEQAARATKEQYGRIDILINVAGGSGPIGKSGVETTAQEFDEIIRLNMSGFPHHARRAADHDCAALWQDRQRGGHLWHARARRTDGLFGIEMGAGMTKSFALEAGGYNINVNCVAPGMVDGPRFREKVCADMAKRLGTTPAEAAERHAEEYALKRITADTDVANACLFLASDAARQITGVDLPVDGGWAML